MSLNHPDVNPTAAPCVMVIFGATGDLTKRNAVRRDAQVRPRSD